MAEKSTTHWNFIPLKNNRWGREKEENEMYSWIKMDGGRRPWL